MDTILSLETLPVELLHRIFDNLDVRTLLLSLQYVCQRLNSIVHTYNRYKFNFQSISKSNFQQLCRCVHSNNIISLILSDDQHTPGQIELFLSLYPIETYTRLQSITLISIEESYLKIILEHLSIRCLLTSLTIRNDSNDDFSSESIRLISTILEKNCFRQLDLTTTDNTIDALSWPIDCSVRHVRFSASIVLKKFSTILRSSPYLHTIIIRDCVIEHEHELNTALAANMSYPQLISLTLEDCDLTMTMIESFFFLTPSLVHLTIKGTGADFFDGARWERLLQIKLPNLNKFQFAFQNNFGAHCERTDFEAIVAPFRTKFWLETKHWYISTVGVKKSVFINLYSIPDCAPKISFHPRANKISRSTVPSDVSELITMNSVRELTLDLIEMQMDMKDMNGSAIQRLFNKVTKLILRLNDNWPRCSLKLLSSLIDLFTIIELEVSIDFNQDDMSQTIDGIVDLLERTINVRTLIISSRTTSVQDICSIVSTRIQHLHVPIKNIEDMKMIFNRLQHLFSVTFYFHTDLSTFQTEIVEWLTSVGRDFAYQSTRCSLSLWLGKMTRL